MDTTDVETPTGEDLPVEPLEKESTHFTQEDASLMDAVLQEYQELADIKDVYIPVVGYTSTGLSVRYRMPENTKELSMVEEKVNRQTKDKMARNINSAIDTMCLLCIGLYVKHPDRNDVYVELDPAMEGSPVRFDDRLVAAMKWQNIETARQTVRKLFRNNEIAILSHAEKLSRWLANSKADLSVELWQVGEGE